MSRLSNEDRVRVLACLVEGNSIRSTVRITGIAKKTVSRLAVDIATARTRLIPALCSEARSRSERPVSSRKNAKLGGWEKGRKRGKKNAL